jgi:transcriptional regulator with XRE-family HTH domain
MPRPCPTPGPAAQAPPTLGPPIPPCRAGASGAGGILVVMDRDGLAEALRTARGRLRPADVGLPAGTRRRVPGLRREEVAHLAGVSVDYLTRLEQGRGPHPSTQVLGAMARALRLSDDERAHLFHLAGAEPPRPGTIDGAVRASTLRLMDRLTDLPALVMDAKGDILAWNPLAAALLGDFSAWPPHQRNIAWQRFLGDKGRVSLAEDEAETAQDGVVASLRAVAARYPDDPGLARLVADLRAGSTRFARLWAEGRVEEQRSKTKTIAHPDLGEITLDCDVLHLPDTDQRLVVYSAAPATPAAQALDMLRVVGTQQLHPA